MLKQSASRASASSSRNGRKTLRWPALSAFLVSLVLSGCAGPVAEHGWYFQEHIDEIYDEKSWSWAFVTSEGGDEFLSLLHMNGNVWLLFWPKNKSHFSYKKLVYRIDEHPPIEHDPATFKAKSIQWTEGVLYIPIWHGDVKTGCAEGTPMRNIFDGRSILLRYYPGGIEGEKQGSWKDARFHIAKNKVNLARALGWNVRECRDHSAESSDTQNGAQ